MWPPGAGQAQPPPVYVGRIDGRVTGFGAGFADDDVDEDEEVDGLGVGLTTGLGLGSGIGFALAPGTMIHWPTKTVGCLRPFAETILFTDTPVRFEMSTSVSLSVTMWSTPLTGGTDRV